ncbi:MAG: hypothetical protein PWP23_2070 [Candidatus Sumerlaeota bacterium]|nr:hypothetical protein [Candidatus Sumerlaeota bacterium]
MKTTTRLGATLLILAAAAAGTASAQTAVYQTSFETSGDPSGTSFALGSLSGVGGWTVESGGTASVASSPLTAPDGSNYVALGANTSISRAVSSGSGRVLLRGHYFGSGSSQLQVPDSTTPMAAVLGFRTLDASTFTVAAYDGVAGDYVEASGSPAFSNSQWHKIIVSIDYTAKQFDVSVDNTPLLQNVNFRDSSVTALSGFQSYSEASSNVDRIGFFSSTGDADGDGVSDDVEMATPGADPLDPSLPGIVLGDLDGNDTVTPADAQAAFECWLLGNCTAAQISVGDIAPNNGSPCIDFSDGDGTITPADAQSIFEIFMTTLAPCK